MGAANDVIVRFEQLVKPFLYYRLAVAAGDADHGDRETAGDERRPVAEGPQACPLRSPGWLRGVPSPVPAQNSGTPRLYSSFANCPPLAAWAFQRKKQGCCREDKPAAVEQQVFDIVRLGLAMPALAGARAHPPGIRRPPTISLIYGMLYPIFSSCCDDSTKVSKGSLQRCRAGSPATTHIPGSRC